MTDVTFWFDPLCPWCWITSRWLEDVKTAEGITVSYQPFSLLIKNEKDPEDEDNAVAAAALRGLRACEAARAENGDEAVAALYTELGNRIHIDDDRTLEGMAEAIAAVGLGEDVLKATENETLDATIQASMDGAIEAAGDDVGVPLIRFGGQGEPAFFGPVIAEKPTGEAAALLYRGFRDVVAAGKGGFFELKRTRTIRPNVGERAA